MFSGTFIRSLDLAKSISSWKSLFPILSFDKYRWCSSHQMKYLKSLSLLVKPFVVKFILSCFVVKPTILNIKPCYLPNPCLDTTWEVSDVYFHCLPHKCSTSFCVFFFVHNLSPYQRTLAHTRSFFSVLVSKPHRVSNLLILPPTYRLRFPQNQGKLCRCSSL